MVQTTRQYRLRQIACILYAFALPINEERLAHTKKNAHTNQQHLNRIEFHAHAFGAFGFNEITAMLEKSAG